jgi:hypothetical protein
MTGTFRKRSMLVKEALMEIHAHVPKINKTLVHWLIEGVFIVISVALGFAVAQYRESKADRELAARVLKGVQAEIERNLAALEPYIPRHKKWMEALDKPDLSKPNQSGLDVFFATRPELPAGAKSNFVFLRRSAWDAAISGGTLRLIDYDVAAALSDIYVTQDIAMGNVGRLVAGPFSSTAAFEPTSRAASVRLIWLTIADIESSEEALIELYRQHLPLIRAAANHDPRGPLCQTCPQPLQRNQRR